MDDTKSNKKTSTDQEHIKEAHEQAEKDIEKDPDVHSKEEPGDDLDEGELARLEGEE